MKHLLILALSLFLLSCNKPETSYLGQNLPGTLPELFAPTIVNTDSVELNAVFNNSMTEFFFTRMKNGN